MNKLRSKTIFALGLFTILALLMTVLVLWIRSATYDHQRLETLVNTQQQTRLTATLLYTANNRVLSLYRMSTINDPFYLDDAYLDFRTLGETYLKTREQILAGNLTYEEEQTLKKIDKLAAFGGDQHEQVAQLFMGGHINEGLHKLNQTIIPNQTNFTRELKNILDSQRAFVERKLSDAVTDQHQTHSLMILLGSTALLLGLFTTYVVRRMGRTEEALLVQGDRVRALYEASSISGLSLDEQITETLKLGCRLLGMEIGKVCHIDDKNQFNIFLHTVAPEDYGIKAGAKLPLDRTFCSIPFSTSAPVMISHVNKSQYSHHPCYEFSHLESYIAAPIWVNGEKFGTVNFSSVMPKTTPFNDRDKDLVKLIANWISVTLERQHAQQVNIAKEAAEAANDTKSAFLANMSHELRTPLNAIIGYTELLKDEIVDNGDDGYLTDIKKIGSASHHLMNLINDILDLSKIESGRMDLHIEHFAIKPLIKELTTTVQPLIEKNHNTLTVQCEENLGIMRSDLTRLRQILLNLLSNAGKFTNNGTISLKVHTTTHAGDNWISFEVKDTGIGMTDEQVGKIFNAFSQADPAVSAKFGGTGLGLAISKHLCEMIGGEISVDSKKDIGTCFIVYIPMILPADSNDTDIPQHNTG